MLTSQLARIEGGVVNIFLTSNAFLRVTCTNCNPVIKCSNLAGDPSCIDVNFVDPPGLPRVEARFDVFIQNQQVHANAQMKLDTGGVKRSKGPFTFVFSCAGIS